MLLGLICRCDGAKRAEPAQRSGGLSVDSRFVMMKFHAMPSAHFSKDRPVDYFILVEPRADGPVIGTYNDQPIPAAVRDAFGRRYTYVGAASRLRDGRFDVKTLAPGEWFVRPGLVYRFEASESGGLLGRLRKREGRSDDEHASF
jgi:hypothetical protein